MRRLWILTLGLLLGGGFYLLLIDVTLLPEVYLMIGVAIVCAAAFWLSREQGFTEARIRPWWLLGGWRVFVQDLPGHRAALPRGSYPAPGPA